ncbi:AMP-binding protein [Alcaligenaceae bacterium]|nr:AMP-binding protein [Alcaligenaceae bacterium]
MADKQLNTWQPRPEDLESSNVALLMKQLGCPTYEDFYQFSITRPEEYWRTINQYCQVVWSRDYNQYMDEGPAPEFPLWFPGGELNWVDTVLQWAHDPQTAGQPAIIAERENGSSETVTYKQLAEKIRRLAAGLKNQGIDKGDRVGLLMENGIEANVSFLTLAYMGVIVVPLFSGFGVDAILARLASCNARAIISTTGFSRRSRFISARETIVEVCQKAPFVDMVIWKRSPEGPDLEPGDISWYDLVNSPDDGQPAERMLSSSPFMVIYTSGTTGKPKGPKHTHGNFPIKVVHDAAIHFELKKGDVFCWPADMGWIAGPLVSGCALMRGATLVTYDGAPDFPNWGRMGSIIERYKVTHYGSSPTLIRGFAANAELALGHNVASIRFLVTAGEAIDPEHFLWFQKHFGHGTCPVINYTGGTEVSGGLLSSVVVKPIGPAEFNTASPGLEADVIDETGHSLVDEVGELAIRKPFIGMADSFWNDDERYLATYWRTVPGIWVHGDLAIRHQNGSFLIRGRSDDTLKVAGKRLGPAEVEEVVLELDQVSEAVAVGVDDTMKGQKLIVFIIPAPNHGMPEQALEALVANQVAEQMGKPFKPARVYCVKQLPKTRSAKVMRRVIRNLYAGAPLGDMSSLENPTALDELNKLFGSQR